VNRRPDPVAAAIAGELRLLDPAVRSSADRIAQLLHPEFTEIGASGRLYTRPEIIAHLVEEPRESQEPIEVTDMAARLLAPGVVHLTYATRKGDRRARRSSLWCSTDDGWRLYFHQGTLTSA
jgi:hypothetical protein